MCLCVRMYVYVYVYVSVLCVYVCIYIMYVCVLYIHVCISLLQNAQTIKILIKSNKTVKTLTEKKILLKQNFCFSSCIPQNSPSDSLSK